MEAFRPRAKARRGLGLPGFYPAVAPPLLLKRECLSVQTRAAKCAHRNPRGVIDFDLHAACQPKSLNERWLFARHRTAYTRRSGVFLGLMSGE